MSKSQRTKGAVFEREVADEFSSALGREVKRNIGQARDGGNDIDVVPLVVEAKRRATLGTIYGWMQQAINSIPAFKKRHPEVEKPIPVVVMRQDGDTVKLVLLRLSDFLILTRDELRAHIEDVG